MCIRDSAILGQPGLHVLEGHLSGGAQGESPHGAQAASKGAGGAGGRQVCHIRQLARACTPHVSTCVATRCSRQKSLSSSPA
eukprot:5188350-Prymnesium_polylepis.1